MREITKEIFISLSPPDHPARGSGADPEGITIFVIDDGGLPFLMIEGRSQRATSLRWMPHAFAFESARDIDEFAAICYRLLKQAIKAATS